MTEIKDLRGFISALDSAGQLVKVANPGRDTAEALEVQDASAHLGVSLPEAQIGRASCRERV